MYNRVSFSSKAKDNHGRDIDMHKWASKESVIEECEDCLRRLKTDYIDLFQIHWPDSTTPVAETMEVAGAFAGTGKDPGLGRVQLFNYD